MREILLATSLLPLVFLGALELHPGGEAHKAHDSLVGARQEIFSCARPLSNGAAHVHAAVERVLPPCPACLLRLQTRGVEVLPQKAPLVAPDLEGRLLLASSLASGRGRTQPRDARGPPFA